MVIFDTHAHLDDAYEKGLLALQMEEAETLGVSRIAIPNCDTASLSHVLEACAQYPGRLFPMCGLHPTYIKEDVEEQLYTLQGALYATPQRFIAVGEIGLDLYWRKDNLPEQMQVLRRQLQWAADLGLPFSLHSRDAFEPAIQVVSEFRGGVRGVFHCFSGSEIQVKQVLGLGCYIGIGGNVTYKSNPTLATLQAVGLKGVVLETDSPYLAPIPFRGKPNQPAYTRRVAEFLADGLGISLLEVAQITTGNAQALFDRTT